MGTSDFHRDDQWQKEQRDRILAPHFYSEYAQDGRYVFIDKGRLASTFQKRFAVDTILQGRDGRALCIEEKIVRWPKSGRKHTAFCLETESCTVPGHESPGWMKYGQADYLLYCFQLEDLKTLECHLIDFDRLQKWFWPCEANFPTFGPLKTLNKSLGRKVNINAVKAAVPTWTRTVGEQQHE